MTPQEADLFQSLAVNLTWGACGFAAGYVVALIRMEGRRWKTRRKGR